LRDDNLPILPIDTGRYGTPETRKIFEEETRVQKMLDVEAALAWAHAEVGTIPREAAEKIAAMASTKHVKLGRIKEIEREIKHDVAALVRALAEVCGPSGAYVHLGATSYDIVDTATALQLKEALELIEKRLNGFEKILMEKALQYKNTLMIGRTHGQHALPITLGFKFAVWMLEISRHIQRLRQCKARVLVGKMSGAVGVQAGLGPHAMKIQELVMQRLGIKHAEISTQIVQRDRHAELVCLLAMIASTLDNFATEIRQLQRPEIGELFEAFETEKRFIIPEACILIDHMLFLMSNVVANLYVDEQSMLKNIELTQGRAMSEAVMIALTMKGMNRQEAHELLRKLAIKSKMEKKHFREILLEDKVVREKLSEKEVDDALNPRNYLGTALEQVELMVKKAREEREARGLT